VLPKGMLTVTRQWQWSWLYLQGCVVRWRTAVSSRRDRVCCCRGHIAGAPHSCRIELTREFRRFRVCEGASVNKLICNLMVHITSLPDLTVIRIASDVA
jgi:hypothetical protein